MNITEKKSLILGTIRENTTYIISFVVYKPCSIRIYLTDDVGNIYKCINESSSRFLRREYKLKFTALRNGNLVFSTNTIRSEVKEINIQNVNYEEVS